MVSYNHGRLEFTFEFGPLGQKLMQAEIEYGDIRIPVTPIFHKEKYTCTVGVDVELPAQVRIHYSGKNSGADTLIDSNGNIVQDLCVKITNMKIL